MLKKHRWIFVVFTMLFGAMLFFSIANTVQSAKDTPCGDDPQCKVANEKACKTPGGLLSEVSRECFNCGSCSLCDVMSVFVTIATRIFMFAGGLALIIFIWGGIELIMSQGYSEKVQSGRKKMRGTVVGLIIIMLAWLLVGTIISVLMGGNGTDITNTNQQGSISGALSDKKGGTKTSALTWYQLPECQKSFVKVKAVCCTIPDKSTKKTTVRLLTEDECNRLKVVYKQRQNSDVKSTPLRKGQTSCK